jgi:hypothetical protein
MFIKRLRGAAEGKQRSYARPWESKSEYPGARLVLAFSVEVHHINASVGKPLKRFGAFQLRQFDVAESL